MSEILAVFKIPSEAVDIAPVFCELQKDYEQTRSCAWSAAHPQQMPAWAYPLRRRETAKVPS
jgi:hypothetical protein